MDRYAYVNNNPLRYNDPSGHCAKYQTDEDNSCLEQLQSVEDTYGLVIDDSKELWTLGFLNAISKGMGILQKAIGADAFAKLFTGVTFSIGGNVDPRGMATTGHRDILLGTGLGAGDSTYIKQETVHELAHIWDNTCHDCMSKGLMRGTGGRYINGDYKPCEPPPPSTYALKGREEDWAESVTAFLFPGYSKKLIEPGAKRLCSQSIVAPTTQSSIFKWSGR